MRVGVVILSATLCVWIPQYITCCYGWKQMHWGIRSFRRCFYSYSKWHLFSETVNKSNLFLLSFAFHTRGRRGITPDDLFHFICSKAIIRPPLDLLHSDKFALVPNFLQPQSTNFWHPLRVYRSWKHNSERQGRSNNRNLFSTKTCYTELHQNASAPQNSFHFHATLARFSFCGEKTSVTLSAAQ